MALTIVAILAPTGSSSSINPFTNTFTTSAEIGDTVVVLFNSSASGTLNAPTDSAGNTYTVDQQCNDTTNQRCGFATTKVTSRIVGGTTTLSVNTSGASFKGVAAFKISNISYNVKLRADKGGQSNTQASTAAPVTGTSGVFNNSHEFILAAYCWNSATTFAEPAGWTNPFGAGSFVTTTVTVVSCAIVYKEVNSTVAVNPSATLGVATTAGGCSMGYFTGYDALLLNNYQAIKVGDGMSTSERIR